jgi:hypothetical protein
MENINPVPDVCSELLASESEEDIMQKEVIRRKAIPY